MINLLHLSDLHFGYDKDSSAQAERDEALDLLIRGLGELKPQWKPKILVISGDLTWKGKADGYTRLAEWLTDKLFPSTGLTAKSCVICPGNHDVEREKTVGLLERTTDSKQADKVLRPKYLATFAAPFHAFCKFAEDFGIPAPKLDDKPNYLAGVHQLEGLRFICVNSAWFCRDSQTDRGQLWLGLPQLRLMPLMNPDDYDTAPVTLAVLHHPQDWFAKPECSSSSDRPVTCRYLAERAHAILSGHTHGGIERSTRLNSRAWLFHGGATYHTHDHRNNFSILRIDPENRTIVRRPWELDPRGPKWEEKPQQKYSLSTEPAPPPAPPKADTSKYFDWLRAETRLIELHELKADLEDKPQPEMDALYFRLTTAAAPFGKGTMEPREAVPLDKTLNQTRLVVEGDAGSGKTTFLRRIAWALCRQSPDPVLRLPAGGFPIFLRVRQLDAHVTVEADPRCIVRFMAAQGWGLDEAFWEKSLQNADTFLLVDGMDEAGNQQRREQIVEMLRKAAAQYDCHIVVTTRPGALEGKAALDWTKMPIAPLDPAGIEGFLRQWCRWLKGGNEDAAKIYYGELFRAVIARPGIRRLARNPLMLTSLAVVHLQNKHLPEQRAALYELIMQWLAAQAERRHPEYSKDLRLRLFGYLALAMQEWKGGHKLEIGEDTAAEQLGRWLPGHGEAAGFVNQAQMDSGIITLHAGRIAFWHRSFQEYLAARTLAGFPDTMLYQKSAAFLSSPEGREVLPLLAARMAESAQERLDVLLEELTRDAAARETLERKAHAAGVLGHMLSDVKPAKYVLKETVARQYGEIRDAVMAIFVKGKARGIDLQTRVAAAEALDQASQARLRTPGDEEYWKEIRGGTFTIGDLEAHASLPVGSATVPTFRIGRFPVTVWEYGKYLDGTDAAPPPEWDEQVLHPSRPVVYVDWHAAQRYCQWAGCQLPTEQQWEFAARGTEGRIYPWGPEQDEPDEHRANFGRKVGQPTPVGMFPDGDTPEGVADMAGNVWEWTRSDIDKDTKCVRGASFNVDARVLRAASRFGVGPVLWLDSFGFRCVRE
ncbi:MAG: SUMF1/EgtB/PvdO family nonheme iron enzyme [Acidobacteria bacterium]|nr:SUMF1/EgtB/PvdO family nonheme iron enzyme [Acidobacteriota bacterium]